MNKIIGSHGVKYSEEIQILDTGRTSSADPERPCLQKKEKICVEMSIDRPAVTPSNLMYV